MLTAAKATSGWQQTGAAVLLLVVCGVAAYANGFTDLFLGLDARESIRDNPHIRHLWPLSEALSLPRWGSVAIAEQHSTVAFRPTFSFVLAATHAAFGLDPRGFHAVSLAVHLAAGIALFGVVRQCARRREGATASPTHGTCLALAVALLWLLHPLQTESVTYFVQMTESLMGLLLLLSLYCAIRGSAAESRRAWLAGAVFVCALSMGAKQTAVVTPLLVLLYDHTFGAPQARLRYRPGLYAALLVPISFAVLAVLGEAQATVVPGRTLAYILAQPGVILHYLRLTFWPDALYLYVNTTSFAVASAWDALLPAVGLVLLLVVTVWGLAKRHVVGFLGGGFFVTLAPTSSVFAITDVIQEHRMYVPLAAVAAVVVLGGEWLLERRLAPRLGRAGRARLGVALVLVASAVLALRTQARNLDYHREFAPVYPGDLHETYRILADHALSSPQVLAVESAWVRQRLASPLVDRLELPYAHLVLGLQQRERGNLAQAVDELQRAIELDPNFAYAQHHLGLVLRQQGDLAAAASHLQAAIRLEPSFVASRTDLAAVRYEQGYGDAARAELDAALRQQPGFAEAHYQLGVLALDAGDSAAAAQHFASAIADRPDHADAQYELGMLYRDQGELEAGLGHLQAAVRWRPELAAARFELGSLLRQLGEEHAALEHLRAAVRLAPAWAEARNELGAALAGLGDRAAARRELEEALRLRPKFADPHVELGILARAAGELDVAEAHFQAAISDAPEQAAAHRELGLLWLERGRSEEARALLHQALRLDPDDIDAQRALQRISPR